jgi:8-oxo-dGTP pyrophosphatase MutT (NUDIX family)
MPAILSRGLEPSESIAEALSAIAGDQNSSATPPTFSGVFCYLEHETWQYVVDCVYESSGAVHGSQRPSLVADGRPDTISAWILDAVRRPPDSVFHYHPNLNDIEVPPTFQEVRRTIGTDWLPVAAATAIVEGHEGKVLLQRRSDDGTWATPGGAVDCGEEIETAASRELWEETGLSAIPTRLISIRSGPNCAIEYPHGDRVWFVGFVFLMEVTGGAMNLDSEETVDLQWFHPDHLPENMNPYNRACALNARTDHHEPLVD